jgi:hypothetical protein
MGRGEGGRLPRGRPYERRRRHRRQPVHRHARQCWRRRGPYWPGRRRQQLRWWGGQHRPAQWQRTRRRRGLGPWRGRRHADNHGHWCRCRGRRWGRRVRGRSVHAATKPVGCGVIRRRLGQWVVVLLSLPAHDVHHHRVAHGSLVRRRRRGWCRGRIGGGHARDIRHTLCGTQCSPRIRVCHPPMKLALQGRRLGRASPVGRSGPRGPRSCPGCRGRACMAMREPGAL